DYGDYTVGWICALPTELAAAKAMLDEQHQALPARSKDNNIYVLGRVGDHNVVIVCLLSQTTGTAAAASVSQQKLATFGSIRFGLMVGIGAAHSPAGQPAFFSMDTIMSMVLDLFYILYVLTKSLSWRRFKICPKQMGPH
ncbi:hypothetical protein FOC4_g10002182, partial [Fusarium odoratissimum]